jgi:hypothetical protein
MKSFSFLVLFGILGVLCSFLVSCACVVFNLQEREALLLSHLKRDLQSPLYVHTFSVTKLKMKFGSGMKIVQFTMSHYQKYLESPKSPKHLAAHAAFKS